MKTFCTTFLDDLDAQIKEKHLLNHPFYQAWSRGELSLECLQEYAKEYYHHVKAFPTYISALHAHTECPSTRKALLQNLMEEEGGSPNHPDLWKNFALSLGVKEEEPWSIGEKVLVCQFFSSFLTSSLSLAASS